MLLTREKLLLDLPVITMRIKRFIKDCIDKTKSNGIVLGISGGIDSSTSAVLSTLAIGSERVLGLSLPEKETFSPVDMKHTRILAERFGFKLETIDMTNVLEAYYNSFRTFSPDDLLSKGNIKARARMICIYYYANSQNRIVIGTSDKSETMMGYFTKWGDGAADISPLMNLYKTQIRQLATYVGIPAEIVQKPSSPSLWPGQFAEEELGVKYETLDLILLGLENSLAPNDIAKQLNLPETTVSSIKNRWLSMEHKRRLPLSLKPCALDRKMGI